YVVLDRIEWEPADLLVESYPREQHTVGGGGQHCVRTRIAIPFACLREETCPTGQHTVGRPSQSCGTAACDGSRAILRVPVHLGTGHHLTPAFAITRVRSGDC